MDANLIKQVTEEFAAIDWFSKAGEPAEGTSTDFRVIADEREAKATLNKSPRAGAPRVGMGRKAQTAAIPAGIARIEAV